MGRLIDAEELKERFCEENCGKNRCVDHMDKCAWILSVEESKTAFDVDKVVEQLKTKKKQELLHYRKHRSISRVKLMRLKLQSKS